MLYDGLITEELVQDWIQELKQADLLDEDGTSSMSNFNTTSN